jgi:hypothetical protein
MRQIDRSKTCMNVGDEASLNKALERFGSCVDNADETSEIPA